MKQTSSVTFHGGPADGRIFIYPNPLPLWLFLPKDEPVEIKKIGHLEYHEYARRGDSFDYDWVKK